MDPKLVLVMIAFLGGSALSLQVGVNSALRGVVGTAMQATFISFSVGAVAALAASFAMRDGPPALEKLAQTSPWMWLGGLCGVTYVWATIVAGPKLGATLTLSLAIAGQLLAALLLDHFGALGLPRNEASLLKLAGVACVIMGVVIIGYARNG
jgi:transporter family-2 protein